ncbi:MAG: hypothetical protein ACFFDT_02815 [Candidatus Hodarchaeota archaeon]
MTRTLPSYYSVEPDEVLICTDKPVLKKVEYAVNRISKQYHTENITKIVEVDRDPEWYYHQAHVRRAGFHEAKYNKILTGDIDLLINNKVHKALNIVGKNNVGLVSLSKFSKPRDFLSLWSFLTTTLIQSLYKIFGSYKGSPGFSGLYAIWRPYWLNSESEEEAKRLINPKQLFTGEIKNLKYASAVTGEDSFLRDCMKRKYDVRYLDDIAAIDLGVVPISQPHLMFRRGQNTAKQGGSFIICIGRSLLRVQPFYLKGYLYERTKHERK